MGKLILFVLILLGGDKIEIIDYDSVYYPISLRSIENPPKTIYAEGNIKLLNTNAISIIGSRACSIAGMNYARKFAQELASKNLTIVSGMAIGIDTYAHTGCLDVGGTTIAVLGSGFNNIFPKENIKLYHNIIKNNGLIISEYPPSVAKNPKQFLERNRIVSGLSIGVLVIEAAFRSGTSVTASLAKKQNKKIFCIPHSPDDKHGTGTNKLLKNGAILVTCAEDILNEFDFLEKTSKKNKKENFCQLKLPQNNKYIDVYNALNGPPATIDEICERINKSAQYVNNALFTLELDGFIVKTKYGYQIKL